MINFKEWCDKNRALERTEELFWQCFQLYKEEEPEEFAETFSADKDGVTVEFEKISYEALLPEFNQELVAVYLTVYVNGDSIGWFKNMFKADGTQFDEFFVIE